MACLRSFAMGHEARFQILLRSEKYSFNILVVSWSIDDSSPLGISSFERTDFVFVLVLT